METAPTRHRSLLTNTLYAVAGNGFFHLCNLGVLMLLAKCAGPALQGQYLLGLAVATPVVLFCGLELRTALVTDARNLFTFGTYRALRSVMMLPALLVLGAYLIWYGCREHDPVGLAILAGVFVARIAWALAEVGWGTYQRRERLDLFALSYALRGLAALLPFVALLPWAAWRHAHGRLTAEGLARITAAAVGLHAAGFLLLYVLFDRPRVVGGGQWDLSWTRRNLLALAVQTFPLGLVALLINLCDSFPRYMFEDERVAEGTAQLGYFGSLAYITLAGNLVIVQAATAAANRLALYYLDNVRAFLWLTARLLGMALGVGLVVLAIAIFAGRWLLALLFTPAYADFEGEFRLIVLAHALALLTNILGTATTQMRLFWLQVPMQVVTFLATAVAAAVLIPGPTPVRGAAYAVLVRAGVQFVLYVGCFAYGLSRRRDILSQELRP